MIDLDVSKAYLSADEPIRTRADDLLGRTRVAELIANQALSAPADAGFVMGLTGPWGVGKTSLLNLVEEELRGRNNAYVLRFNPWIDADTEQLNVRFILRLAAEFTRLGAPAATVRATTSYAAALSGESRGSQAAVSTDDAADRVAAAARPHRESPLGPREKLAHYLRGFNGRFVVFIDDLDRLERAEIRAVLQLVKAVGDLPHFTYVLAFSRERVEAALRSGDDEPHSNVGRHFLEKIFQVEHHVTPAPSPRLHQLVARELRGALASIPDLEIADIPADELLPADVAAMIHTLRQGRRWINASTGIVWLLGEAIDITDLLALEGLRLCEPAVHAGLGSIADALTVSPAPDDRREELAHAQWVRVQAVIERAATPSAVRSVLTRLFPAAAPLIASQLTDPSVRALRSPLPPAPARIADPALLQRYLTGA